MLFWLSARCRPFFSAAGAFLVNITIIVTTIFRIGHFGDTSVRPIEDGRLQSISVMLFVTLCALVLAALFAERRQNEANLALSNTLLERERENKLMNIQAIVAAISHELRQPLAAMTANASAAQRWLARTPSDQDEANAALDHIKTEGLRVSEMFDGFRALFGKNAPARRPFDINDVILSVLNSIEPQLREHEVVVRKELMAELPLIEGHSAQLRELVYNLVNNAVEAMRSTNARSRVLRVRTEHRDGDTITVSVQDSGPGIEPNLASCVASLARLSRQERMEQGWGWRFAASSLSSTAVKLLRHRTARAGRFSNSLCRSAGSLVETKSCRLVCRFSVAGMTRVWAL
jgi:signal transduction histidine kinase